MWKQLLLGGIVSFANFGIHALMTGVIILLTHRTAKRTTHLHVFLRVIALLTITMIALMCAHVVEIAVWALFYGLSESTPKGLQAFEFASPTASPSVRGRRTTELNRVGPARSTVALAVDAPWLLQPME